MAHPSDRINSKTNISFSMPADQHALELSAIVAFMRGASDRRVFRRFERLNLYNLLYLQRQLAKYDDQISVLERDSDGLGLARILPQLEPLLKSYSRLCSPYFRPANTMQMKPFPNKLRWLKLRTRLHSCCRG